MNLALTTLHVRIYVFPHKNGLLKSCSSFGDHQCTFTGASFSSTSEFRTSAILEWLRSRNKTYGAEVTHNGMASIINFIKIFKNCFEAVGGDTDGQTEW
jgi:hypothetical protein